MISYHIISVGNSLAEDILDFEAAGADAVITKPMQVQCLDRIVSYCDLRRGKKKMKRRRGRDDDNDDDDQEDDDAHISFKQFLASYDNRADD